MYVHLTKFVVNRKLCVSKRPMPHSVPRINHGKKILNAVNKMMAGPSEWLCR